jgi:Fe-S-cluster-containing hydrogenase component 2
MDKQVVIVDLPLCKGCGTCVEVCPSEAISLAQSKAYVDDERCTGCEVCIDACPEGAIQPVIQGELIPAPQRSVPAARRPSLLTEPVGVAAVATGVGILVRAAEGLARAAGRWLLQQPSNETRSPVTGNMPSGRRNGAGRGRRARRRRRGR